MKSAVAPNIFATEDVSIGTGDRNARRVQSLQVLIKIIRSYSAEILRLTLLFLTQMSDPRSFAVDAVSAGGASCGLLRQSRNEGFLKIVESFEGVSAHTGSVD